jgi:hypothetical protein
MYSEKTYPRATLFTTNPTPDFGSNPGHHGGKAATNRLSYGAPPNTNVTGSLAVDVC